LLTDGAVLNFDGIYHGDINIYITNNCCDEGQTCRCGDGNLIIEEQSEEIPLLGNEAATVENDRN